LVERQPSKLDVAGSSPVARFGREYHRRMSDAPFSTSLSHLLVAFTIELDNEFERRMAETAEKRPFRVSVVMWSNFLRVVGDGIAVGSLPSATGLAKGRMLSTIGGMERWRYVEVVPAGARTAPESKRDGFGSARGLQQDWLVRPTAVGRVAREIWPPLFGEIERRWDARFGRGPVLELRRSLTSLVERLDARLPEYLPIVSGSDGMVATVAEPEAEPTIPPPLSTLLAQALLAYTLEFERESPLSFPLAANVVRMLDKTKSDVRELPAAAGVSKEAISMALTYLTKHGFVEVDRRAKLVGLTPRGLEARESASALHAEVDRAWKARLGGETVERLRAAAAAILAQRRSGRPRLVLGLEPHPEGWRASGRYLAQTRAMLADPATGLPAYPMVLHRGGWPDGS
jgi:DNA-binding MarR family transcriptional regulator